MAVINTNYLALVSQNNLNKSQSALGSAIERLSSGLRINSAKDDAAGQAIANRFTANINGLTQAARNSNDGISIAQTTEGALNEINNNLQRIRQLSVQATNGTNSDSDLKSIQDEINQRLSEIDRVSGQTQFNGVHVLAKDNELKIQVGANDGETISVNLSQITAQTLGLKGFNIDGVGTANDAATAENALSAGYIKGATDANGTTTYTKTFGAADAAKYTDVLAKMQDGGTVVSGTTTYTYDASKGSYSVVDTARSSADTIAALKPAAGQSVTASVTIGGQSHQVKIDSNGAFTDAATGNALYLDGTGNLSQNNAGSDPAATLANVLPATAVAGDGLAGAAGNTLKIGDVTITSTGTADAYKVTGEVASKDAVSQAIAGKAATIDVDGAGATAAYAVAVGGAVTQGAVTVNKVFGGDLTTATTNSVYAHGNGNITDGAGNVVYADQKGLTLNNHSGVTATEDPLAALDTAMQKVDSMRSALGAVQNRFESTIANLNNTITNLSAARSRIEDADYATEVSNMTRAQILQQAGTAVLAQANQVPQTMLSLLR